LNIFQDFDNYLENYKNEIKRLTQENAQDQQLINSLQSELKKFKQAEVEKTG